MPVTNLPDATLRQAHADDLDEVTRLLNASHLPLDGVAASFGDFVVAESDGTIVGVAGLERCETNALLRSVAVADTWRSHGVGRALVERILAMAESRGIPALYLLTTTAEGYFPNLGFEKIDREEVPDDIRATSEFQGACPASATVMMRVTSAAS
jgi:amino-acid N-acetyltransferase